MTCLRTPRYRASGALAAAMLLLLLLTPARAAEVYHCYFGNTHSHTRNSDGKDSTAEDHFSQAKAAGFDFYAVTDHALRKYKGCTPENYEQTRRLADRCTDPSFVAIAGFEFSENDGPDGTGHLTTLNTATYLDATGPEVNLPVFYDWLATQTTPSATSFNHAGPTGHASFGYITDARRDAVSMFEMINSGKLRYEGFLAALNKGWRVAPIAAQDGHGTWRITRQEYRTGVLATGLTRDNLVQAMRDRRVYCTWDKNLRLSFSANGFIMGSVLRSPRNLSFRIDVYDPDTSNPEERITKMEIVGRDGVIVASKEFSTHAAAWSVTVPPAHNYYFLQVHCADKLDGPTAYSSPIWVE